MRVQVVEEPAEAPVHGLDALELLEPVPVEHVRPVETRSNLTIVLIGLPLVIARGQRNLFLSAGVCAGVVTLMALILFACHALGASRILSPPALSAWLPLILFAPVARIMYGLLR